MVDEKSIVDLSQAIARAFRPERIILFGSYAYGRPTPDSDVDLLVIMPFRGHGARKAAEILNQVRSRMPVDLLVRTPAEIRRRLAWNDFFLQEVMEKGRVLYESTHPRMGGQGGRRLGHRRARTARPKVAQS